MLEGDRLVNTPYKIDFRKDVGFQTLCKKTLNKKDLQLFRDAVKQDYYFQVAVVPCKLHTFCLPMLHAAATFAN